MNPKISSLYQACENLRMLHAETAVIKHAIKDYKTVREWVEYNPTHFIYVFFCFNSLYSVNWKQSLKSGKIDYNKRYKTRNGEWKSKSETQQFHDMLSFCFYGDNFAQLFSNRFLNILLIEYDVDTIFQIIETIKEDIKDNGRINETNIRVFKDSMEELLINHNFCQEVIENIIWFIYDIRCNVFHGTKELAEVLLSEEEQEKLKLYSYILIAVNQMIISKIDYMHKVDIMNDSYTSLINNLRDYIKYN